jgi:nucleoside-diphosphate-sugar epimerase
MKIFLTGATGYVGNRLAEALVQQGHTLHALVRNKNKQPNLHHPSIRLFEGDVTDKVSVNTAMEGCDTAIHTAALAVVWPKRMSMFEEINIEGTQNVLNACLAYQVPRLLYTSTAGTLGPSDQGIVSEKTPRTTPFFNEYERTKSIAEKLVLTHASPSFHTSVLNLTRVFGPGQLSESNATTKLIQQVAQGKWRIIPGDGSKFGNYVYIEDVISAHLLALDKAASGEKYIIGGDNLSFDDFFKHAKKISGARQTFVYMPVPIIMFSSYMMELSAKWFGITPKITPAWARRYMYDWKLSSDKAIKELGYNPTSFDEACLKTLEWLKQN